MSLAVFLDLDGVLTPKAVNLQYAAMLGVEKDLVSLEDRYANGLIRNVEFNEEFIPLFRKANFTRQFAEKRFGDIVLSTFAEELIQINLPNTFVVTSSPSYYIDRLVRKFDIAPENVICSRYEFDADGLLARCSSPSGIVDKANFVQEKARRFSRTIGVGDSPEQDGRFLAECGIRVLMGGERRNYLHATDLYAVVSLVRSLRDVDNNDYTIGAPPECKVGTQRLLSESSYDTNVFIMTPFRADARYQVAISTVKDELRASGLRGWTASDMDLDPNHDLWMNVRCFMHGCRFGIAIITAHETADGDTITIHRDVFNPNVIVEAGYMMGQGKDVLVLKDQRSTMPTDWLGKLFRPIDLANPEAHVRAAVRHWIRTLQR